MARASRFSARSSLPTRRHLLIALASSLIVSPSPGIAAGIAIVSRDRILRESASARRLREAERALTAQLQASIDAARAALDAEEAELARLRSEMTEDEFQARAENFDQRIRSVRRVAQERAAVIQRSFQDARARLVMTLPEILEQLRVEHGVAAVLDADQALAFDGEIDLTAAAIELLNSDGARVEIPQIDMSAPLLQPITQEAGSQTDQ